MLACLLIMGLQGPPDAIASGAGPVHDQIRVAGLDRFPDHAFVIYFSNRRASAAPAAFVRVHDGDAVPVAPFCNPALFAIREPLPDLALMPESDAVAWLCEHGALAGVPIESLRARTDVDPGAALVTTYRVTAITGSHLDLSVESEIRTGRWAWLSAAGALLLLYFSRRLRGRASPGRARADIGAGTTRWR